MRHFTSLSLSAALFGVVTLGAPPAHAVHLEDIFELENLTDGGDAIDDLGSPEDDWGTTNPAICGGGLASCGYVAGPSAPGGNSLTNLFLNDVPPPGGLDDVFTGGGSKDDLDINGWKWTTKSGVTDKDDIQQGGAAAYNLEGETLIYFFQTLLAPNGDAAAGLWLFQDNIVPLDGQFKQVDSVGNAIGVAKHKIGDVFVSAQLSNGGREVAMTVYKWVGFNDPTGACPGGAAALAPPKKSLCIVEEFVDARCDPAGPGSETACGTMNLVSSESPDDWGYTSKFPPVPGPAWPPGTNGIDVNDFPATTFFEGGVNLNELGLTGCFSTFLLETRSSDSVRATLKDFTMGDFPLCGIDVTKVCSPANPDGSINPDVGAFGDTIVTTFDILIDNTGVSTIYDVTLEEDNLFDVGESCRIYPSGDLLNTDAAYPIAASLASTDPAIPVTVMCETFDNPFVNKVTIRAKTSTDLIDPDLEDSDELVNDVSVPREAGGACPASFDSGLVVVKECEEDPTTLLLDASGRLQIEVGVNFSVTNTGDEKLLGVILEDDKIAGLINFGDLLPGETKVSGPMSYIADKPDGPGDAPWEPHEAFFKNRVEVTNSVGALSGEDVGVGQWFDVECPLCD